MRTGELDALYDFFSSQADSRRWYGFWNYGDVMHTYDQERHTWRYDIGGCAWHNAELGTDLWFWIELAGLLEHAAFADAVAEYGDAHAATKEECAKMPEGLTRTISLRWSVAKLAAYSAARNRDPARARRCWELLLQGDGFGIPGDSLSPRGNLRTHVDALSGRKALESGLSTNHDSQWALNAIACLALVPEALTQEMVEKWRASDKADGKKEH